MLTGVWTESSANTKDGWLSDDACRDGKSKRGVPALLRGLEKLNEGLGSAEQSEPTEGDLWKEPVPVYPEAAKAALPEDILRAGADCTEAAGLLEASSSTEPPCDDDVALDGRCERKDGLGGASPASSAERCFLPGDIP